MQEMKRAIDKAREDMTVESCGRRGGRGKHAADKELAIGRWNERKGSATWISVKDRMPEPDKRVLVFGKHGYDIAQFGYGFFWSAAQGAVFRNAITHWMPLPDRPGWVQP
jgi:hypothetical protein